MLNAATLLGDVPDGDFQLSARVTVGFATAFDAGVLLLWLDERHWDKFVLRVLSGGGVHGRLWSAVVSPMTRTPSWCPDRSVWLRVSRIDRVYAYHASLDGKAWRMIRVFVLDDQASRDRIGFEGQSPTGDGCSVTFDEIRFMHERLADLRDGS